MRRAISITLGVVIGLVGGFFFGLYVWLAFTRYMFEETKNVGLRRAILGS